MDTSSAQVYVNFFTIELKLTCTVNSSYPCLFLQPPLIPMGKIQLLTISLLCLNLLQPSPLHRKIRGRNWQEVGTCLIWLWVFFCFF